MAFSDYGDRDFFKKWPFGVLKTIHWVIINSKAHIVKTGFDFFSAFLARPICHTDHHLAKSLHLPHNWLCPLHCLEYLHHFSNHLDLLHLCAQPADLPNWRWSNFRSIRSNCKQFYLFVWQNSMI